MQASLNRALISLVLLAALTPLIKSDTPAHCFRSQIIGKWTFKLGKPGQGGECGVKHPITEYSYGNMTTMKQKVDQTLTVFLHKDHSVRIANHKTLFGHSLSYKQRPYFWEMVYDEGLSLRIGKIDFLAYWQYRPLTKQVGKKGYSLCGRTFTGWYQFGTSQQEMGCFIAVRAKSPNKRTHDKLTKRLGSQATKQRTQNILASVKKLTTMMEAKKMNSAMATLAKAKSLSFTYSGAQQTDIMLARSITQTKAQVTAQAKVFAKSKSHVMSTKKSGILELGETKTGTNTRVLRVPKENLDRFKSLPTEFSWMSVLRAPISQKCGSCYSVTSSEIVMARARINLNKKIDVDYQAFIKCNYMSQGCDGGFAYEVFRYLTTHNSASSRCFASNAGQSCNFSKCKDSVRVKNYYHIGGIAGKNIRKSELEMMYEIKQKGPIAVNIKIFPDFQGYSGGIYKPLNKTQRAYINKQTRGSMFMMDHAVMVFGWGEENGHKFWWVRNSWGAGWGLGGNFKIARGVNAAGIESLASGCDLEFVH